MGDAGRIPVLDGIRGCAIVFVLLYHASFGFVPNSPTGKVWTALSGIGWCGVDLFFVLSGFLITGILRRHQEDGTPLRVFYWRRVLRIFPPHYAVLLIIYFLATRASSEGSVGRLLALEDTPPGAWPWFFTLLGNFFYATHGPMPMAVGHFWSLGVEEQFYLVWPFVTIIFDRRQTLMGVCGAGILAAPYFRWEYLDSNAFTSARFLPHARMDALLIGALLALLLEDRATTVRGRWAIRFLGLASALGLAVVIGVQGNCEISGKLMSVVGMSCLALSFAWLIYEALGAPEGSRLRRAMEARWLRMFGTISYTMYLVHWPLFMIATALWPGPVGANGTSRGSGMGDQLIYTAVVVAVCFGIAWLSWHGFEKRILSFRHALDPSQNAQALAQRGP